MDFMLQKLAAHGIYTSQVRAYGRVHKVTDSAAARALLSQVAR